MQNADLYVAMDLPLVQQANQFHANCNQGIQISLHPWQMTILIWADHLEPLWVKQADIYMYEFFWKAHQDFVTNAKIVNQTISRKSRTQHFCEKIIPNEFRKSKLINFGTNFIARRIENGTTCFSSIK